MHPGSRQSGNFQLQTIDNQLLTINYTISTISPD